MNKPVLCIGDANADLIIQLGQTESIQSKNLEILSAGHVDASPDQVVMSAGGVIGTTACTMAAQGCPTLFLGHGGDDYFGRFVKGYLEEKGVDTRYYTLLPTAPSLMVFCLISPDGERDFRPFPFNGSAPTQVTAEDLPEDLTDHISVFFTSGVQLTEQPVCDTVLEMMRRCNEAGIPVAFDINLRTNTFGWGDEMKRRFASALSHADIIFGSADEELPQVTGTDSEREAVQKLLASGNKTVVAKNGGKGSAVYAAGHRTAIGPFPVPIVDTVGAGDTFNGGYLAALRQGCSVEESLLWASATAAYTLSFEGAGHQPTHHQVRSIIERFSHIRPETEDFRP